MCSLHIALYILYTVLICSTTVCWSLWHRNNQRVEFQSLFLLKLLSIMRPGAESFISVIMYIKLISPIYHRPTIRLETVDLSWVCKSPACAYYSDGCVWVLQTEARVDISLRCMYGSQTYESSVAVLKLHVSGVHAYTWVCRINRTMAFK